MPIEVFSSQTIADEQDTRTWRRRDLRAAFDSINKLIINTGKYPKAEAAMTIVQNLVAPEVNFANGNVIQLPSTQDEPEFINSVTVSKYKAEVARHEYFEHTQPQLLFLLNQLDISFRNNLADHVIADLLQGIIFLGADINAFIANGQSGEILQSHKLERQTETIPEELYELVRQQLYETYVHPATGQIQAIWQISTVTINGKTHDFSDWVEVIAKPITAELLEKYLAQALTDGKFLKSNTHLALFEMLCESGGIQTLARLPDRLAKKGYDFKKVRQSPKPEEIIAIEKSINTNAPVYVE